MNKFVIIIVFGILSSHTFAQNIKNLSDRNRELYFQNIELEHQRENRIANFIDKNPSFNYTFNKEGKYYVLYDVIDGNPIFRSTNNLQAGTATKANKLQVGGNLGLNLDGSGMTVGVWDVGPVQADHVEFVNNGNSRITLMDNVSVSGGNPNSHSTHVAGTIGATGIDANAKGMATNVQIKSYNWTNDRSEVILAINDTSNPIILSNHSYGVPIQNGSGTIDPWIMGAYNTEARAWDELLHSNPYYLMVKSAGNEGTVSYIGAMASGYDKLTSSTNAKNNFVIANANPSTAPITGDLISIVINPSSSQGPTDDLRVKPDIAGDGTDLYSSIPTDAYDTYSGTSMSAPNVTGILVLLQQYYHQLHSTYMKSATLKALVCNTTVDVLSAGPDPKFGWGFIDAEAAANAITANLNDELLIEENTLEEDQVFTFSFENTSTDPIRATLCWTDVAGVVNNGILNDSTPRLMNDLDIVISKDGVDYMPWKLELNGSSFNAVKGDNIVDNIEIIDIDAPTLGTYTVTISHKGDLTGVGGGPFDEYDQDYSLVLRGEGIVLGVEDIDAQNNSFEIYPNPVSDVLKIKSQDNISGSKAKIFNTNGQLIQNGYINTQNQLEVSQLEKGNYVLIIEYNGQKLIKKFIKK